MIDSSLLATKLHIPSVRSDLVPRPRLTRRLDEGLERKLTLVSAPAGFGKTTLASEWAAGFGRPVAWLSLDGGDNDLTRFLSYISAALQTTRANLGAGALDLLQSPGFVQATSVAATAFPTNLIKGLVDGSAGLSSREIARKLIIAVGTVKAHTSAIYRKLDVRGRTQAVIRARELNLV